MTNTDRYEEAKSHMPFGIWRDLVTPTQFTAWVAGRKKAGRVIDTETCEVTCSLAPITDPYGTDPDVEQKTHYFVRSAESDGWICETDLPPEKREAMRDRFANFRPF